MDGEAAETWNKAARAAWDALVRMNLARGGTGGFTLSTGNFVRSYGAEPVRWDDAADAALASRLHLRLPTGGMDMDQVAKAKAIRIGFALAFPGLGRVSPTEEQFAVALSRSAPVATRPGPAGTPPPAGGGVPFTFAYDPDPPSRRYRRLALGEGVVHVGSVEAHEAPVAYELERADGSKVPVRSVNGTLYRPVMRPGEAVPATLDEFARACSGHEPWKDTPFMALPHDGYDGPVLSARELAHETSGPVHGKHDASVRAAMKAGRFVLLDGVVYRETPPPTIHLVVRCQPADADEPPTLAVAWRMGTLDSETSHATLPVVTRRTMWPVDVHFPEDMARFAEAVVRRVSEGMSIGFATTVDALAPRGAPVAAPKAGAIRDIAFSRHWDSCPVDPWAIGDWAQGAREPYAAIRALRNKFFQSLEACCALADEGVFDREDDLDEASVMAF